MTMTTTRFKVFANLYKDSVTLMQLGAQLRERDGIARSVLPDGDAREPGATAGRRSRRSTRRRRRPICWWSCAASPSACDEAIAGGRGDAAGEGRRGRRRRGRVLAAADEHRAGRRTRPRRRPRADLRARRLRRRRGDEGAGARPARHAVFRQRVDRRRAGDQDLRARQGPAGDGAGLRHGDRQRRSAGLRQRRAARRHRPRRRLGNRLAGGHLPHPQPGRRRFAGARHGRPRSEGGDRRHHDAAGARCAGRRPGDARDRADLQAALARHRPADRGRGGRGGQARRRAFSRRDAGATARRACSPPTSLRHAADVAVALARGEPAPTSAGDAGRCRARGRRTVRGHDGAGAEGRSRAVHRRHVLLRGAAGVHRARPAVPLERAGQGRRCRSTAASTATSSSTWATTTTRAGARIR